jgi:hypothetical protein
VIKGKAGDYLFIKWLDACSVDEWLPEDELKMKPCEVHTLGICVESAEKHITVSLNHDVINNNFSCTITIPRGMIFLIKKVDMRDHINKRSSIKR